MMIAVKRLKKCPVYGKLGLSQPPPACPEMRSVAQDAIGHGCTDALHDIPGPRDESLFFDGRRGSVEPYGHRVHSGRPGGPYRPDLADLSSAHRAHAHITLLVGS